ncbi:hypothetical protein L3081_10355 [Colwellia sp. MSW7]|uniref:Cytochrome c domain-containing protein n=1 Tax=Colwellia maritima TaxID=2912588 RepID=A0ABS9X0B7_9GAMM|nr:hypothetical protein [Colwellia maritima]MCI2283723.1 hypothetical protein [Colwellia maritima]
MKFIKLLLPVVVLIINVFSVQAQHVSDPSLVAKGAKVYSENCGRCHNARPTGRVFEKRMVGCYSAHESKSSYDR